MADNWYTGNAGIDGASNRGWLIGHFMQDGNRAALSTEALEVKWGVHGAGEHRADWTTSEQRTTLVILIAGRQRIDLTVGSVVLAERGDYVVWGPGIDHTWEAEQDSVVLTVRWPSLIA